VLHDLAKLALDERFTLSPFAAALDEAPGFTDTDGLWAAAYARHSDVFDQAFAAGSPFTDSVLSAANLAGLTVNQLVFRLPADIEAAIAATINKLVAVSRGRQLAATIVSRATQGLVTVDEMRDFGWGFALVSRFEHLTPATRIRHIAAATDTALTPEHFSWLERVGVPLGEARRLAVLGADSPGVIQRAWRMGWPDDFIVRAARVERSAA